MRNHAEATDPDPSPSASPRDPVAYATRFQDAGSVRAYEEAEYGSESYSSLIWRLQQPFLRALLTAELGEVPRPPRLLDFACGTGRILSFVETLVAECEGVDISPAMVEVARRKCTRARLLVGDPLARPELLTPPYDIITSFRFLLNVEPRLRHDALGLLHRSIRQPGGLLLINMHGNSRSSRHPAVAWKRWRQRRGRVADPNQMLNEMSPEETRLLLQTAGFQIVRQLGFGLVPPTLYRTPLRPIALALDRCSAGRSWAAHRAIDLLFVCRPAN